MSLGPFYVGQKPGNPLVFTVRDQVTNEPKDLSIYTGASLKLAGPDGTLISTTANGGAASILSASDGTVRYSWPTVSLFSAEGDHTIQVTLTATNVSDLTSTVTVEVYDAVGG